MVEIQSGPAGGLPQRLVADLVPYANNSRVHPEAQVQQIAESIRRFGFTVPVLVAEDGTVIAGHGRVLAAKLLGLLSVPVLVAAGWSDEQRRAYTIADNKLAENAEWDTELLKIEIGALLEMSAEPLVGIGFSQDEIDAFLAPAPDSAAGAAGPAAPKVTLSDRFGVPPFSVISAREGWWQDRKRAWLALGIMSELGRGRDLFLPAGGQDLRTLYGPNSAAPSGSAMPAMDYANKARGDGRVRAIVGTELSSKDRPNNG